MFLLNEDYLVKATERLGKYLPSSKPEDELRIQDNYYSDIFPFFEDKYKYSLTQCYGGNMYPCFIDLLKYFSEKSINDRCYHKLCAFSERIAQFCKIFCCDSKENDKLRPIYKLGCFFEDIPFRDKFIYSFTLREIGLYLLKFKTVNDADLRERIIKNMHPIINKFKDEIKNIKPEATEGIDKFCEGIIKESFISILWDYIAYFFEIGNWLDKEIDFTEHRSLYTPLVKPNGPIQSSAYHLYNSLAMNNKIVKEENIILDIETDLIYSICLTTWEDCIQILGKYDDRLLPPITEGLMEEVWNNNPFAVLLTVSIILTELPYRICWKEISLSGGEQIKRIIPYSELMLDINSSLIRIVYNEKEIKHFNIEFLQKVWEEVPIQNDFLNILPEIFSPKVFNYFDNVRVLQLEYKTYKEYLKEVELYNSKIEKIKENIVKIFFGDARLNEILQLISSISGLLNEKNLKKVKALELIPQEPHSAKDIFKLYNQIINIFKI